MGPTGYAVVNYNDELEGIYDTLDEAKRCLIERIEEGCEIEGWRLYQTIDIPYRVEIVTEQVQHANIDTDIK